MKPQPEMVMKNTGASVAAEEIAQEELSALAVEYESLNRRLRRLADRLPVSPLEGLTLPVEVDAEMAAEIRRAFLRVVDPLEVEHPLAAAEIRRVVGCLLGEPDVGTEIRRVVDCLLGDHLTPAVEEIKKLAAYRPEGA